MRAFHYFVMYSVDSIHAIHYVILAGASGHNGSFFVVRIQI